MPKLPSFESIVETKIAKKYDWHQIETKAILTVIKAKRALNNLQQELKKTDEIIYVIID